MKFNLNTIQQFVGFLIIYAAGAFYFHFGWQVLGHLLATVGFSLMLFFIFTALSKRQKNIYNTVITALIIFLLLHYGTKPEAWYFSFLATFVAVFSKFFLEYKGLPIINPTVLGVLAAVYCATFFGFDIESFASWWGTSYQGHFSLVLILLWLLLGMSKWNKSYLLISFLLLHLLATLIFAEHMSLLRFIFLDSTIYFYAAVMLIDPKSSPADKKQQIIFAIIAVVSYHFLQKLHIGNYELWSIFSANLYNAFLNFRRFSSIKVQASL